jgi:hypothetical protein
VDIGIQTREQPLTTLVAELNNVHEEIPPHRGILTELNHTGDSLHTWDKNNPTEVEAARTVFDTMVSKGLQAFATTRSGEKGAVIRTFDPEAQRITFAPALQGG